MNADGRTDKPEFRDQKPEVRIADERRKPQMNADMVPYPRRLSALIGAHRRFHSVWLRPPRPRCRLLSLQAAGPVFGPICFRVIALGLRLTTQSPAGRVALQAAGRIAV